MNSVNLVFDNFEFLSDNNKNDVLLYANSFLMKTKQNYPRSNHNLYKDF